MILPNGKLSDTQPTLTAVLSAMAADMKLVMTLGNSIIGVSVLAMPYCFKQCGIVLSTVAMILSSFLTRFACHLLLKGTIITRRKTYEHLAYHTFGTPGKRLVEISVTGFMLGILISFFVVIGDLGSAFLAVLLDLQVTPTLRNVVMVSVGLGAALPLSLLKNLDSLANISTLSFSFYVLLVFKIFYDALPVLFDGSWYENAVLWRPWGVLQCLPIFSMSLSCQTQLFEIFDGLHHATLSKMNAVVRMAVNMCTAIYISVGLFGYLAFSADSSFSGNILTSLTPSFTTEFIKFGFLLSLILSFPLVIFPCRASLYSLLFRKGGYEGGGTFIPDIKFKLITFVIVVVTLSLGTVCPNIEIVLGVFGSTIGNIICILLPALIFIQHVDKDTFEKYGAQLTILLGVFLLVTCTWVTLYVDESAGSSLSQDVAVAKVPSLGAIVKLPPFVDTVKEVSLEKPIVDSNDQTKPLNDYPIKSKLSVNDAESMSQTRKEPPVPQEFPNSGESKAARLKQVNVVDLNRNNQLAPEALEKEAIESKLEDKMADTNTTKKQLIPKAATTPGFDKILARIEKKQDELMQHQGQLMQKLKEHDKLHPLNYTLGLLQSPAARAAAPVRTVPNEEPVKQEVNNTEPLTANVRLEAAVSPVKQVVISGQEVTTKKVEVKAVPLADKANL